MDGVIILNEIEVVQVVNNTFNFTAAFIALIVTTLVCAVIGFFVGGLDYEGFEGALMGVCIGLILSIFIGALVGAACSYPPETKTTMRYEVIIDDSVSLVEFYEHYNVIEQRGEIFVVEEKN